MKLRDYLKRVGMKHCYFATQLGISKEYLSKLLCKRAYPSRELIYKIWKETDDEVTPYDWLEKQE